MTGGPGESSREPILIVIPAWNEQECIRRTVSEVKRCCPHADVFVVSDGSIDATAAEARAAGVVVAELPYNLGVGGAMRTGFRYAVRHGYSAVIQVDADGQHDPQDIPRLVAALADADVVIGARFSQGDDFDISRSRKRAIRTLAWLLSKITHTHLTDATSGFRATGTSALRLFSECYPDEYLGDTVESLVIGARAGLRIQQVPVRMRQRQGGRSSHGTAKSIVYLVRAVIAIGLTLMRRRPIDLAAVPTIVADRISGPAAEHRMELTGGSTG